MPKYLVSGKNVEYLQEQPIEADNKEQAESKYEELWNNGFIPTGDSEIEFTVEEVK